MDQAVRVIREFIAEHAAVPAAVGEIEMEASCDDASGHYLLMMQGWRRNWERVHGCMVHVDVRGDKVYVQHDGTEEGIANRLIEAGFPANRIVLCFHAPHERAQTPFALG